MISLRSCALTIALVAPVPTAPALMTLRASSGVATPPACMMRVRGAIARTRALICGIHGRRAPPPWPASCRYFRGGWGWCGRRGQWSIQASGTRAPTTAPRAPGPGG